MCICCYTWLLLCLPLSGMDWGQTGQCLGVCVRASVCVCARVVDRSFSAVAAPKNKNIIFVIIIISIIVICDCSLTAAKFGTLH